MGGRSSLTILPEAFYRYLVRNTLRYALEIAYNGGRYLGWQQQEQGISVQSEMERCLSLLLGHPVNVTGCGRTDKGVHARQFFLHFDTEKDPGGNFVFKLNLVLPPDIAAASLRKVKDDFHARFDCNSRAYEYRINRHKSPFLQEWSYYRYGKLDVAGMNTAAAMLLEHTDFQCFSKTRTDVKTFNCTITEAYWEEKENGDILVFHIKANRFLRNMVRAIVGTLLDVGKGQLTPQGFEKIIESRKRLHAGQSVPANGLYLTEAAYPWRDFEIDIHE